MVVVVVVVVVVLSRINVVIVYYLLFITLYAYDILTCSVWSQVFRIRICILLYSDACLVVLGISECGQCANEPGRLHCRWFIAIQYQHCSQTAVA